MVFGFGHHHREDEEAYNTLYGEGGAPEGGGGSMAHEAIAGAVGFFAMREFERRRSAQGIMGHGLAKEMIAAIVAAEVEKHAERMGMSYEEKERAKQLATSKAHSMYESQYMGGQQAPQEGGGYMQGGPKERGYDMAPAGGPGYAQGGPAGYEGGGGGYQQGGYTQQEGGYAQQGGYEQRGGGYGGDTAY